MNSYDLYFFLTLATILITRVLVFMFNKPSPTIKNFRTHPWMFGLIFTVLLFCISNFYTNIYLLSISMGIFIDEIGFIIIIKGKTHEDNYSPQSFMIVFFFILLLFLFRKSIVHFYFKCCVKHND